MRSVLGWGLWLGLGVGLLSACGPALEWRRLSSDALGLRMEFPCKPRRHEAGAQTLWHCEADGVGFSVAAETLADGVAAQARLVRSLPALADRAGGVAPVRLPASAPLGAVAWPQTGRFQLAGPDRWVVVQVWVRGKTFYQALVVAPRPAPSSLRFFETLETLP